MTVRRTLLRTLSAAVLLATPVIIAAAPVAKPPVPVKPVAAARPVAAPAKFDSAGLEFFERKVRPVLVQTCFQCHSASSEKLKAGLYCDSREGLLKGGDSGPSIVPGSSAKSLFVKAIRGEDKDLQMPPKQKLTAQQIADLTRWVDMGAPWPAEKKSSVAGKGGYANQDERYAQLRKDHWAWQPVKMVAVPAVQNASWPKSDLDKFVLAKLEENNLKPINDADRVSLIRRVTFDLIGLPPRPEEVVAFVSDKAPDAFEKVVDRLLASPQFGETWGRHWLDVARYSESTGSARNYPYHPAWRYRDYVIDSMNADKPYNTFIKEQIAGDLLPARDAAERNEHLVATGFLAMGVKDLNEKDRDKFIMDNVDEQIDTLGRSILATTIACARCHDHKFDPIPTTDYYQMAGIFKSTEILSGVHAKKGGTGKDYGDSNLLVKLTPVAAKPQPVEVAVAGPSPKDSASKAEKIQALTAKIEDATAELRKMRASLGLEAGGDKDNAKKLLKKDPEKAKPFLAKRDELQQLKTELATLQGDAAPAAPIGKRAAAMQSPIEEWTALGVRESGKAGDCRVNLHGDHENLGAAVPRGFISLIKGPSVPTIKTDESGRMQLAMWLSSPENPLTARVMVNRIWHNLFGQGLVRTVDNFGSTGEAPSHPELLDYLAKQFVREGWSVKKMIRSMVLSRTYQLAARYDAASYDADPGNTFLWRHSQKRLEAEQIRDALLFVGGNLDLSRPIGSPVARMPEAEIREGRIGAAFDRTGGTHRSVYVPVVRALLSPMMDAFDFAEPTMVTGQRDVTTVATQALFMMNNSFTIDQSRRLADKLLADSSIGNDAARVDHCYGWTLGRSATQAEKARALAYIDSFVKETDVKDPKKARSDAWTAFCQALVASGEFRYLN